MKKIKKMIKNSFVYSILLSAYRGYFANRRSKFGFIHPTAFVRLPSIIKGIENVYIEENSRILGYNKILTTNAKFIVKKNCQIAEGLTVVTGNHYSKPGMWFCDISDEMKPKDMDRDVVINEDVWMGTNVTLLAGVIIGRGAVIGSGAVCRNKVPPYAIVVGNPAKVVGFRFLPDEIIKHEEALYKENDRISKTILEKNYNRYFFYRKEEIVTFLR